MVKHKSDSIRNSIKLKVTVMLTVTFTVKVNSNRTSQNLVTIKVTV